MIEHLWICLIILQINSIVPSFAVNDLRVVLAIDENNKVAEEAISQAARQFRFITYTVLKTNEELTEAEICKAILKGNTSQPPALMIDATLSPHETVSHSSDMVKRVARKLGLPTVATGAIHNYLSEEWRELSSLEKEIYINVRPPGDVIPEVIRDVVEYYRYKKIAIFYDDSFMIDRKITEILENVPVEYSFFYIDEKFNDTLNEVKTAKFYVNFVFGSFKTLNEVLRVAELQDLFFYKYTWYLITKEAGKLNCSICKHGSVMLVQPLRTRPILYDHQPEFKTLDPANKIDRFFYYDLTRMSLKLIEELAPKNNWPPSDAYPKCGDTLTKEQLRMRKGLELGTEIDLEGHYGRYGKFVVKPETSYQEVTLRFNKVELWRQMPFRMFKSGEWIYDYPTGEMIFTAAYILDENQLKDAMGRATPMKFKIVTMIQPPFMMKRYNSSTRLWDYYGYCMDLLDKMKLAIFNKTSQRFEFDIFEVADGKYGDKDPLTGKWDGLIGVVERKEADIAIGPVHVMAERESAVDFTVPYYDLVGISLLMKKPISDSHIFKFLTVLTNEVWAAVGVLYMIASIFLWLCDVFSPYSLRHNREKYRNDIHQRDFNFKECMWFCMTSITPQGGGEPPHNLSGRVCIAAWWMFGFTLIAVYTANLAAFLTVSRLDPPIETLEHLADQYRVKYAPVKGSLEEAYFIRRSYIERQFYHTWTRMAFSDKMHPVEKSLYAIWNYPVDNKYTRIWTQMQITGMPKTFEEGMRWVRASYSAHNGFALVGEATRVRWAKYTNCDMIQSGNEFSRKPLALAVQENSTIKDTLNSAILQLLNERKLEAMKEKWWNDNVEKKTCEDQRRSNEGISIKNIGGIFVVIFVGVALALLSLAFEYVWEKAKKMTARAKAQKFGHNIQFAMAHGHEKIMFPMQFK